MNKTYIDQIARRLKCSKAKREEIKKQLTADIMAEMENGESEEALIRRMGTPAEIAEEFNSSFPPGEQRKYKKEKWRKRLLAAAFLLILLGAGIYWVMPRQTALKEGGPFREPEVRSRAEEAILLLNAGDYESLQQMAEERLKSSLTAAVMEKAKGYFAEDWGELQSFGNSYIAEVTQMGERYAVIQLGAAYEHTSVSYTISFDTDMKLAGFYMK